MTEWHPIASAPPDRKVDLWAKAWRSDSDTFVGERFPDCRWDKGDSMVNRPARWGGLPDGWHPTHWSDVPNPPVEGARRA